MEVHCHVHERVLEDILTKLPACAEVRQYKKAVGAIPFSLQGGNVEIACQVFLL